MRVLDTNVISEPLKARPNPAATQWLDEQDLQTLFLTAVSVAELLFGVELLPDGKRKRSLHATLLRTIEQRFPGLVLPFDEAAAREYASMASEAQKRGYNISFADGQIASIAKARGFAVATRDEKPFRAMGIETVNPWDV